MKNKLQIAVEIVIAILTVLVILQPEIPYIKFLYENAIWLIFVFIFIGLISMFLKRIRLVYFSMISAAIITFFLQTLSNGDLMLNNNKINSGNGLHVLHINVFNYQNDKKSLIKKIKKSKPDIISFEEWTPDFKKYFIENLKNIYPYYSIMNSIDADNKIVLSKHKIIKVDTFYINMHPQLDIYFEYKNSIANIIFVYLFPELKASSDAFYLQTIQLADYVKTKKNPFIIVGDFNQVYWSKSIRNFLLDTKLKNARRYVSFAKRNPYEHIFYSDGILCNELNEVYDTNNEPFGIEGIFTISGSTYSFSLK